MGESLQKVETDARTEAPPPRGAAGEKYDFAAAVSRYETPLLRYVAQLLGSRAGDESEVVVQEAFLRLHRQTTEHGEASVGNLQAWLFRVAHNLALDALRRRRSEQRAHERAAQELAAAPADSPDALEAMIRDEVGRQAVAELHRLPDHEKHVLLLRVMQGMTMTEIAEVTGLTVGNVGYRIDKGLRELARRLKAGGVI